MIQENCALLPSEIETAINRFEVAWFAGNRPNLVDYLPSGDSAHFDDCLIELIRIDLEFRHESGEPVDLETYLQQFPSLRNESAISQIAFEDYRMRMALGTPVDPFEYKDKFGIDVSDWPIWQCVQIHSAPAKKSRAVAESAADLPELPRHPFVNRLPEIGEQFAGFELVGLLGEGAFGRVYLARQDDLARRFVALKVSRGASSESQHLARLQHTNIVPVYSVHRNSNLNAICMPFLGLATLNDLLHEIERSADGSESGRELISTAAAHRATTVAKTIKLSAQDQVLPLILDGARQDSWLASLEIRNSEETIICICERVADGLTYAHSRGIVHGDLKPANILISDEGQPLILDFHLSSSTNERDLDYVRLGGTLPYMSAEHLQTLLKGGKVDELCDVFSLGVVMFQLFTGELPYPTYAVNSESTIEKMIADRKTDPADARSSNSQLSADVASMIAKCLAADRAHRYQSAGDLQIDLSRHLQHLPLKFARNRSLVERARKWVRRHPKLMSATTVLAGSLGVILVIAALLMSRQFQVTRLQAEDQSNAFVGQLDESLLPLSFIDSDPQRLARSIRSAQDLLGRNEAANLASLTRAKRFQNITPQQQASELQSASQLNYWLASAWIRQADSSSRQSDVESFLRTAAERNELAIAFAEQEPVGQAIFFQRAEIESRLGHAADAERFRSRASEADTHSVADKKMIAAEFRRQNKRQQAFEILNELVKNSPRDFSLWVMLGNSLADLGNMPEAEAVFTVCISLEPDSDLAFFHRGLTRFHSGRNEAAIADFDQAIKLDPEDPHGYFNRALAKRSLHQLEQAEKDLDQAIELGISESRVYFVRSRVRAELKKDAAAQRDFERGLSEIPRDELSWIARALAKAETDPQAALQDLEQTLQKYPNSTLALQNQAALLAEDLHQPGHAIEIISRWQQLAPQNPEVYSSRGVLYARSGRRQQAHSDAQRALGISRDPDIVYQVAGIYALTSRQVPADSTLATDLLSEAVTASPLTVAPLIDADSDLDAIRGEDGFKQIQSFIRQWRILAAN